MSQENRKMIKVGQPFSIPLELPFGAKELKTLWIPPGTFVMGSPEDEPGRDAEDEPQFEVTITNGFWLSQYPITQAQWGQVMHHNPSHFKEGGPNCPVENVTWHQAVSFCDQLAEHLAGYLPKGYLFSLPTEAQWEYACRAGTQTTYYTGNTLKDLSKIAWHKDNSLAHTHVVGEKEPNGWGLHDMLGNVFEWCYDSPSDYPASSARDWVGNGDGFLRNIRGGSWGTPPDDPCFRCASRCYVVPDEARSWFGFRACLSIPVIDKREVSA